MGRYVDDLVSSSPWICADCLPTIINDVYDPIISFDASNDITFYYPQYEMVASIFLDLHTFIDFQTVNEGMQVQKDASNHFILWIIEGNII